MYVATGKTRVAPILKITATTFNRCVKDRVRVRVRVRAIDVSYFIYLLYYYLYFSLIFFSMKACFPQKYHKID